MEKAAHGGLAEDQGCLAETYVEHVSSRMIFVLKCQWMILSRLHRW